MIAVRDVSKNLGKDTALNNVSFNIEQGRALAVFGRSGAGKSTLLEVISGVLTDHTGQVSVFGHDIAKRPKEAKKHLGFMPANVPIYPDMTVSEFLRYVGGVKGIRGKELEARTSEISRYTCIHDYAHAPCGKLDGADRKLLGIAQAIISDPEYVILDEPAGGVVGDKVSVIHNVLNRIKKNSTLVIGTSNLREVGEICESVIVMSGGRVVVEDSIAHIKSAANEHSRVRIRLETGRAQAINMLSNLSGVDELLDIPSVHDGAVDFVVVSGRDVDMRPHLWRVASMSCIPILEMRQVTISIDEMLMQLTGERSIDASRI